MYEEELVTEDAVPVLQRLVVGEDERVAPFEVEQEPLTTGTMTTGVVVIGVLPPPPPDVTGADPSVVGAVTTGVGEVAGDDGVA